MFEPRPSLESLGPWVERLAEARTSGQRDRLLLDAVRHLVGAPRAGLWRWTAMEEGPAWRPWLESGEPDPLPPEGLVRAALEGDLDPALPGGAQVVPGRATALVLSRAAEDGVDLAHALLVAHALLEDPNDGGGAVEGPAWLPDPEDPGAEPAA